MSIDELIEGSSEFEQRTRQFLNDSAEQLPASVRSRLTQARYAALASRPFWRRSSAFRWAPAGAAAVVALLLWVVPRGESPLVSPFASATPEDLALLADTDALQLGGEQDVDADFYEWAAGEAALASTPSVGT
jgi:anti-sigma-K factor RskA